MNLQRALVFSVLTIMLLAAFVLSVSTGAMALPEGFWWQWLSARGNISALPQEFQTAGFVVMELRLPRTLAAVVVGLGLAVAGVGIQGLFRNPLADPGLVGVASGAALGAVFMIVGIGWIGGGMLTGWFHWLLPLAAFAGGIIATLLVYLVAWHDGRTNTAMMLLAGVAINALAGAGTGVLTFMADDNQLRDMTFWSMGSLAKVSWQQLLVAGPLIVLSAITLLFFARALNALLMGEQVAGHIGFSTGWLKNGIVILAALIIGAAVAIAGVIGFVGLVVPHLGRLMLGSDHRVLLPASAMTGAVLLLVADSLSRVMVAPAELPIGLLMSLIGGPFFIVLLMRQRKQVAYGLAG